VVDFVKNGSISGVKATRIALIIAGSAAPDALTADNAVKKITGLSGVTTLGSNVTVPPLPIGATDDANGFSFTDNVVGPNPANGIYQLGDGDTALDGLIIVQGNFTAPAGATVLKLITV
jgi:hypothetical protein